MKTLPKSLHTVTVLVNVARFLIAEGKPVYIGPNVAVDKALKLLGYDTPNDIHGLRGRAIKELSK